MKSIDIQFEVQKIHSQYGTTEMANYQIQKLFDKALTEAIQALSQSEWISVEDRLREIGLNEEFEHASEMILLSDGEFTYYGQYESSEEFGSYFIDANGDDFENDGVEITHWMPLPQPPQTK